MMLKALIVGDAIDSAEVLAKVKSNFQTTEISNEIFRKRNANLLSYCDLIWIHVETVLSKEDLNYLKKNVIIATTSTGYTHIAKEIVEEIGDRLITLKGETRLLEKISSTAELAWMLILMGAIRSNHATSQVRAGKWSRKANVREKQISSTSIGILGFGRLGAMVAHYAKSFGAQVYVWDIDVLARNRASDLGLKVVRDMNELFKLVDILSVHANTSPGNSPLITSGVLKFAKKGLVLVNTSRGSIVEEQDIIDAIKSHTINMYLTDVLKFEEIGGELKDSLLWNFSVSDWRVLITPHIGGASREAMHLCEENIFNRVKKSFENSDEK